jgi:hypothetical protein
MGSSGRVIADDTPRVIGEEETREQREIAAAHNAFIALESKCVSYTARQYLDEFNNQHLKLLAETQDESRVRIA